MLPEHLDPRRTPEERADLLARRMTTLEKAFQLSCVAPWELVTPDGGEPAGFADWYDRAPGHVAGLLLDDPQQMADLIGPLQRRLVERTRLGVPALLHAEALNGLVVGGHAVFPTAIGLAATWSPDLVEDMAGVARVAMRRIGVLQALSPVMDVSLDPRWGRVHETYGEDPYLVAAMSVAFVRGLQGDDPAEGIIATGKHFLGYANSLGGVNQAAVELGARRIRDEFAFPFEAAIHLAGLRAIMNSYSELDGVPVGASREVLTGLLRETLGFRGLVSSDYMTVEQLETRQRVASDPAEAGTLALSAGLDVELPKIHGYGEILAAAVERGQASADDLEVSVRRVLSAKFASGLFENPYPVERIDLGAARREGVELSQELARRQVVLLENDGVLPLRNPGTVAVLGPHADAVEHQFPPYTFSSLREMTLAIMAGEMGTMVGVDRSMSEWNSAFFPPRATREYVREEHGATSLLEEIGARATVRSVPYGGILAEPDDAQIAAAVRSAHEADLVVLALGGAALWFQGDRTEGEASDSADISLPAGQVRLAEAIARTGIPFVVVLFQGRAYAPPAVLASARAVVIAAYGGPYGPAAVAEVLFGERGPEGRLPYSIPRHSGQIPVPHDQKTGTGYRNPLPPGGRRLYLDQPGTPAYPFGAGMTYTRFEIEAAGASDRIPTTGSGRIDVTVRNVGDRSGVAVVQLYACPRAYGVTRPAQQLVGFARVELEAGESTELGFGLDATQFAFSTLRGDFAVEPGAVEWFVGLDSSDRAAQGAFEVVGERRPVASAERVFFSTVSHDRP